MINEQSRKFWYLNDKLKVQIYYTQLEKFMVVNGWGYLQLIDSRSSKKTLFQNDNGILKLHSIDTAKKWLKDTLESIDEDEFINGKFKSTKPIPKVDILEFIMRFSGLETAMKNIQVYSVQTYPDTKELPLFKDKQDVAYVRFANGVVKITKSEITCLPVDSLKDEGLVWETELLPHNITLQNNSSAQGIFEKFVSNAFKREKIEGKSLDKDYENNFELDEEQYRAWRESFGYLVHNHKKVDSLKCIIYIDSEGTFEQPEGGNGKSLLLEGLMYYKDMIQMDGKAWKENDNFVFSSVTPQTKFVLINDLNENFKFDRLFNVITDDMQIEGKGTNKLHIPKSLSPKVAVSTNEVISGVGGSYARRQHIVEFGNYWNRAERRGEKITEHLGKMLYKDGFEEQDWNDFYNFGFKCIQEFLNNGLTEASNSNYKKKSIIREIEGSSGDGILVDWIDNWIRNTRLENNQNKDNGISKQGLYKIFIQDNPTLSEHMTKGWSSERFHKALFNYVKINNGYYYNIHKSTNGDSYSQRRWQLGERGNQKDHVKITTDFDTQWLKETAVKSLEEDKKVVFEESKVSKDLRENGVEPSKYLDGDKGYFDKLAG